MTASMKWKYRATKRCCWKCGKPLRRRGNRPNKTGLCHHCSCVANGRKRLGAKVQT